MTKQIKLENGDIVLAHSEIVGHITGWIDTLVKASKGLDSFGILSALILDTNKKIHFHGGFFCPKTNIPLSYAMGETYFGQYPGTRQVDVFPMYCVIISAALVKKLGVPENLGQNIFLDADYCMTAMQAKFKLYATDKLAVVYQGGPKTEKEIAQYTAEFSRGADSFIHKWGGLINSHYKYPSLYTARIGGSSGFVRAARGYIRGMSDIGLNVFFEPLDNVCDSVQPTPDEVVNSILSGRGDMFMPQITWGQAPWFIRNSGIYKIGHCEFEAIDAPEGWVRYCNMMDELWVPTEWDKKKFEKAGVRVPIYQGIDPNYYHPDYAPMQFDARQSFKFICNAAWFPRKNLKNLIVAFQSEFSKHDDVCLIIKTMNLGLNDGIQEEIKKIPSMAESANVYIKEDDLPDCEMPSFYTAGDCFVLPTHGEGWGLPLFEALACGVPVITTGFGAPNEVLRDGGGQPFPGVHFLDWKPTISTEPYVYIEGQTWAEPNLIQLRKAMRNVYDNRQAEKAGALQTSEIIRSQFSWPKVCLKIKERLVDIYENKLADKK
jgi:glycosyltransferase involved in cell wall biosynthesis